MSDMEYMKQLRNVTTDAVELIECKTGTYGDSWKRRGGPGAWFTVVRPLDRLEGIVGRLGGDIFAAIEQDPTGQDGSALACVRDAMNYFILIEAHARARLGVESHSLSNLTERPECTLCGKVYRPHERWCDVRNPQKGFCGEVCCRRYHAESEPSPASGSHHALERAGEVTQDTRRAGGRRYPGDRLEAFRVAMLAAAEEHEIPVECRETALGQMLIVEIDLRKIER